MRKIPYEKIEEIAEIVLPKVINKIIVDTDNGYLLFNEYYIEKNNDAYHLLRRGDDKLFAFNQLKNAITYGILFKNLLLYEAMRVYEIDRLLSGIEIEKKIQEKRKKKKDIENFIIRMTKLQTLNDKRNKFVSELDKYIQVAKDCQQKGFNYEINRVKRK